jgi:hypothetical protein
MKIIKNGHGPSGGDRDGILAIADNPEEARALVLNDSNIVKSDSGATTVAIWKTLAFIFFGLTILFATDVFELHGDYNGSAPTGGQAHVHFKPNATTDATSDGGDGGVPTSSNAEVKEPVKPDVPAPPPPTAQPTAAPEKKEEPSQPPPPPPPPTASPTDAPPPPPPPPPALSPTSFGLPGPRFTYQRRGQPMDDKDRQEMEKKWGTWTLKDDKDRPTDDYFAQYPNRDIPRDKFPKNAWQTDKDYVAKFLKEGLALVERAQKAILEEYGQPTDFTSDMFHIEKFEKWEKVKDDCDRKAGCTTVSSFDNLKRRLLHAVMTEDIFVVGMSGHR